MSKFSLGLMLALASFLPTIQADEKPAASNAVFQTHVRVVSISPEMLPVVKEAGFNLAEKLSEKELARLITLLRDDSRTKLLSSTCLSAPSGQSAVVECGQTQYFITDVKISTIGGEIVFQPNNSNYFLGSQVKVTASEFMAKNLVALDVEASYTQLDGTVPLFPITTFLNAPLGDKSGKNGLVPFTQFIQQPKIQKRTSAGQTLMQSGQTFALLGDLYKVETHREVSHPYFGDIPCLGELCKQTVTSQEPRQMLFLITLEGKNPGVKTTECEAVGVIKTASANAYWKAAVEPAPLMNMTKPTASCCTAPKPCSASTTVADIAALTAGGVGDNIILNQIRTTGATFSLGTEQLIWLKSQKVSDAVIMAMQNTRSKPTAALPGALTQAGASTSTQTQSTKKTGQEPSERVSNFMAAVINDLALGRHGRLIEVIIDDWRYESDPNYRMRKMLEESEDLRETQEEINRLNGAVGPDK